MQSEARLPDEREEKWLPFRAINLGSYVVPSSLDRTERTLASDHVGEPHFRTPE
jgi:hypothetical protein